MTNVIFVLVLVCVIVAAISIAVAVFNNLRSEVKCLKYMLDRSEADYKYMRNDNSALINDLQNAIIERDNYIREHSGVTFGYNYDFEYLKKRDEIAASAEEGQVSEERASYDECETIMPEEQTTDEFYASFDIESVIPTKKVADKKADKPSKKAVKESATKTEEQTIVVAEPEVVKTAPKTDSKKAEKTGSKSADEKKADKENTPSEKKGAKTAHVIGDTKTLVEKKKEVNGKMTWKAVSKKEDDGAEYRFITMVWSEVNGKEGWHRQTALDAAKTPKNSDKTGSKTTSKDKTAQPEQKKDKVAPKTEEQKPEVTINAESKTADIVSAIADKLTGMSNKTANIKARKQTIGKTEYCFFYITLDGDKVKVYGEHEGIVKDFILCQPRFSKEFAFHVYSTMTESAKTEQTGSKDKKGSKKDAAKEIENAQKEVSKKKEQLKNEVENSSILTDTDKEEILKVVSNIYKTMTKRNMKSVDIDIELTSTSGVTIYKSVEARESGLCFVAVNGSKTATFNIEKYLKAGKAINKNVFNIEIVKTMQRMVNECVAA